MMDNTARAGSPRKSGGRGNPLLAALLGLMSVFEVTFDMLSLVAALLGGVARGTGTTGTTGTASNAVTPGGAQAIAAQGVANGTPSQLGVQTAAQVRPAGRPVGVTIISVLLALLGVFEVGFGSLALVTSLLGHFVVPLQSPAAGAALGSYYLLTGLVKLFFAWGLWRLRRWAFWATVFICALSLLSTVLAVTEPPSTVWAFLPDLIIPLAILVYLVVDSNVRSAFHLGRR